MTTTAPRGVDSTNQFTDSTAEVTGPRHFHQLAPDVLDRLFLRRPEPITAQWSTQRTAVALGATLYVPATRPDLAEVIARRHREGVISMVIDLEDAVADEHSDEAIDATVAALHQLDGSAAGQMLLFVRVRDVSQISSITSKLESAGALSVRHPEIQCRRSRYGVAGDRSVRATSGRSPVGDAGARIGGAGAPGVA